ncbi:MAG: YciI family protein [Thermomicrobiales bacterium]
MKYLCLVYRDEKEWDALPEREYDAIVAEILAYREELRQSGRFIVSDALQHVQTATTIRVRNGQVSITDGPFAETNEQLGGFYLINAGDLNEAIRVASKIPSARLATVEVRPIKELNPKQPRATDRRFATRPIDQWHGSGGSATDARNSVV